MYFLPDLFFKGQTCISNSLFKFPFGCLTFSLQSHWAHTLCAGNTSAHSLSLSQSHLRLSYPRLFSCSTVRKPHTSLQHPLVPGAVISPWTTAGHLLTGHQSILYIAAGVIFPKSTSALVTLVSEMLPPFCPLTLFQVNSLLICSYTSKHQKILSWPPSLV